MEVENAISLESMYLKAQLCVELDKGGVCLRPYESDAYADTEIEYLGDLSDYNLGEIVDLSVVKLINDDGQCYFYCV